VSTAPPAAPDGILAPQEIIDAALAASRSDGCVVVVESATEANVRWANNTVTTNGVPVLPTLNGGQNFSTFAVRSQFAL